MAAITVLDAQLLYAQLPDVRCATSMMKHRELKGSSTTSASPVTRPMPDAAAQDLVFQDLVFKDVVMRFVTPEGDVTAVDHVSFTVARGEFVSIIGPSG